MSAPTRGTLRAIPSLSQSRGVTASHPSGGLVPSIRDKRLRLRPLCVRTAPIGTDVGHGFSSAVPLGPPSVTGTSTADYEAAVDVRTDSDDGLLFDQVDLATSLIDEIVVTLHRLLELGHLRSFPRHLCVLLEVCDFGLG